MQLCSNAITSVIHAVVCSCSIFFLNLKQKTFKFKKGVQGDESPLQKVRSSVLK